MKDKVKAALSIALVLIIVLVVFLFVRGMFSAPSTDGDRPSPTVPTVPGDISEPPAVKPPATSNTPDAPTTSGSNEEVTPPTEEPISEETPPVQPVEDEELRKRTAQDYAIISEDLVTTLSLGSVEGIEETSGEVVKGELFLIAVDATGSRSYYGNFTCCLEDDSEIYVFAECTLQGDSVVNSDYVKSVGD